MKSEFLLHAIGLIDDDLVLDAQHSAAPPASLRRHVISWAAMLLVCVGLGSAFFFFRLAGPLSGSEAAPSSPMAPQTPMAPSAPAQPTPSAPSAPSAPADPSESAVPSEPVTPGAAPGTEVPSAADFRTERGEYALLRTIASSLPEGCRRLGVLSAPAADTPKYPVALDLNFAGCPVWESADGSLLYIQQSEGRWNVARMIPDMN